MILILRGILGDVQDKRGVLIPASIHEAIQVGVAYLSFEKFQALFALVFADVREEIVDRLATDALATRLSGF